MRDPLAWISVKYKLTATFALLGALAFAIGGDLVSGPSHRALAREILGRLDSEATAGAHLLDAHLAILGERLEDFSSDGFIRNELDRLRALHRVGDEGAGLVRHLRENKIGLVPALVDLAVLDPSGLRLAGVREAPLDETLRLARGVAASTVWTSDLIATESSGTLFAVTAPVLALDRRTRVGTIVGWVDAGRWLDQAVRQVGASNEEDSESRLTLEDEAGNTLEVATGWRGRDERIRPHLLPAPAASDRRGRSHDGSHVCRGHRTFGRRARVGESGWAVTVERDVDAPMNVLAGLESRMLAIGLGMALVCGVVFLFPLQFLVRPLVRLTEAAHVLERGDYDVRVDEATTDEIGQLAHAFNQLAAAVKERTSGLERAAIDLEARREEVRTERDRLGLVIRCMSDGLVFLDGTGRVVLSNQAARPLVAALEGGARFGDPGCAKPDGQGCAGCLRAMDSAAHACVVETEGSTFEVIASSLPRGGDASPGRVLVARDVTERLAREARETHQERLAVIGEVAAVVAHELNNPLAAITMFVQMLQSELPEPSPFREHATVIARNAETLKKTIRGLLDFASASEPVVEGLDVHELLGEVAQFLGPLRKRAGIELSLDLGAQSPLLEGDRIQIRQVFVNLVMNAIQAGSGERGRVTIRTRDAGAAEPLVVDVEDDGPGVPPELRSRIFETFFTTKRAGSGTGLGLPISRRIAEGHGGSLELVESSPGRTVFRVTLARKPRPALVGRSWAGVHR